jgi:hypothetical protein
MHAMVAVWVLFTLMLFVIEPFAHRRTSASLTRDTDAARFATHRLHDPERAFNRIVLVHWVLLGVSLVTIAGAVAGSHGYLLFGR